MGQQQLLLIVLGTIIVGVAVVAGINMFTTQAVNSERDAMIQDMNSIAADAAAYWRKPVAMGGGNRTFATVAGVNTFGSDSVTTNATWSTSAPALGSFTLSGVGLNEGVTVSVTVTQNGVSTAPVVVMP